MPKRNVVISLAIALAALVTVGWWTAKTLWLPAPSTQSTQMNPYAETGAQGELQELQVLRAPHKGDIDEMAQLRVVRALVYFNRSSFFFDNGRPRGMSYDALVAFEKFLNRKLRPNDRTGKEKIHVVLVPTSYAKVQSDLLNGNGDIAAVPIYITEARMKIADFVTVGSSMKDLVVSGPDAAPLGSLDDLSGKEVYLIKQSLAWRNLARLNKKFSSAKKPKIILMPADGNLEQEDILEMVNAGLVQYAVVPARFAELWKNVFTGLKVYEGFPVTDKTEFGWAVRKDSPKLRALLEEFASTHREGTAYFAQLANTYLKSARFIENNRTAESVNRFNEMKRIFQKYANQYQFPWMLIAAQAYQESGLRQDVRSPAGAVGVMQVLPSTAANPPISIRDITRVEPNIRAGVKLLRYIRDDYFKDAPMDPLNKTLMTLAAYNAGPARLKQCRQLAANMDLNPNVWFGNVEYAVAKKVGSQTVNYVGNIYKYYLGWKMMTERDAARRQLLRAETPKKK